MDHTEGMQSASGRWCDSWRYKVHFPTCLISILTNCIDFEKTFIQAIVYNYDVLREYGTEAEVKAAGKVLTKGKDYEMVSRVVCTLDLNS